jgi:hypothetical protein
MPMNKDALRPDKTGPYTHVVDRWLHEAYTDIWETVLSDSDEANTVHHIIEGVQMPTPDDMVTYDFTEAETDLIAEARVAVLSVSADSSVAAIYYDDENEYKQAWRGVIQSADPQTFLGWLEALAEAHHERTLYGDVLCDVIEREREENDGAGYISDVVENGCQSGLVGRLVDHDDCREWFIKHIDEIDKLYFECKEEGRDIELTPPLYVHLAWFAYEEIIRRIGQDLGIGV